MEINLKIFSINWENKIRAAIQYCRQTLVRYIHCHKSGSPFHTVCQEGTLGAQVEECRDNSDKLMWRAKNEMCDWMRERTECESKRGWER